MLKIWNGYNGCNFFFLSFSLSVSFSLSFRERDGRKKILEFVTFRNENVILFYIFLSFKFECILYTYSSWLEKTCLAAFQNRLLFLQISCTFDSDFIHSNKWKKTNSQTKASKNKRENRKLKSLLTSCRCPIGFLVKFQVQTMVTEMSIIKIFNWFFSIWRIIFTCVVSSAICDCSYDIMHSGLFSFSDAALKYKCRLAFGYNFKKS